jgi:hypothetical protein
MKRVLYITTEYTTKIYNRIKESKSDVINFNNGEPTFFLTKDSARYDVDWLRKNFPKLAKEYGGPKIVKITFSLVKKKKRNKK